MTIAQTMLARIHRTRPNHSIILVALALVPLMFMGCSGNKPVPRPLGLTSPYAESGVAVWAVAPLRNESGVSTFDELALADTLVNEMQQISGISVLPVNRTLAAMRALKIPDISSASDALALAKALGADGIVVGSVTAYHPYDPPILGLNLALFGHGHRSYAAQSSSPDPAKLRAAATEGSVPTGPVSAQPLSALAEVFDASNGSTRDLIRQYAAGRHDPEGPLGWKRYVASMALYAKFACFEMTRRLLDEERSRLVSLGARTQAVPPR